jgi:hypothetical protein
MGEYHFRALLGWPLDVRYRLYCGSMVRDFVWPVVMQVMSLDVENVYNEMRDT